VREEEGLELWRRCEDAWADWLAARGAGAVMRHNDATSNTAHSGAPLVRVGGRNRRAPDLQTVTSGRAEYWEVKTRSRADVDPHTGQHRHWMPFAAYDDYLAVREHTDTPTWVVLYEAATASSPGRWLQISIDRLREVGTLESRWVAEGRRVEAWMWPVAEMDLVEGPAVDEGSAESGIAPRGGEEDPVSLAALAPVERDLRRLRRRAPQSAPPTRTTEGSGADRPSAGLPRLHEWMESEPVLGLDVLRRKLGIPVLPRYSLLRVGLDGIDLEDLVGLLQYGVRLFVVSSEEPAWPMDKAELDAFRASRLLETAVVPSADQCATWVVDGALPERPGNLVTRVMCEADEGGDLNFWQFRIVHASPAADVVVEAGAGTGKTETMSERIVFLLATSGASADSTGQHPRDLRADEIALVTFTREAAAEMRERIGRALLVRQRLCRRCAQPTLAWLLQLVTADISTIHSLARRIAASSAGTIGLGPDFRVSRLTMEFRAAVQQEISAELERLVDKYPAQVPAAHEWQRHVTTIWEALENNGVDLLQMSTGGSAPPDLDWGDAPGNGLEQGVHELTRAAVEKMALRMRELCLDEQVLPTNQLVPSATAAIRAQDHPPVRPYRYLFVDEFQDTDPAQMDLFLELRRRLGLRLFVVGDVKQGIYRFRGASGNAFVELELRAREKGLSTTSFSLTRNFRSGAELLDSLHRPFSVWGSNDWLPYSDGARLRPRSRSSDSSSAVATVPVSRNDEARAAASVVDRWWTRDRAESLGVLCRQNWQAQKAQDAVRSQHPDVPIPCEILVGGSFYLTPAVRELRAFLEAVADPEDDGALLEVSETRWGAGLAAGGPPGRIGAEAWGRPLETPLGWSSRLAPIGKDASIPREDLAQLRRRLELVGSLLGSMPVLGWLVECDRVLQPSRYHLPGPDDETERQRYSRCLDHLITLLDAQFQDAPLSLERLLAWIRLQIGTNRSEDEPDTTTEGKVVALTVHKAKGLEFDRVVVPWTSTRFGPPRSLGTRTAVRGAAGETPRLLWGWHLHEGKTYETDFTNLPPGRRTEWNDDDRDNLREETRLLYVAMTRARKELVILMDRRPTPRGATPTSWFDLLREGGL